MIKGIIFDFSGPIMTENANEVFEKHSLRRSWEKNSIKKLVKEYFSGAHQGEFKDWFDFFKKTKLSLEITAEEMNEIFEEMHKTKRINIEMIKLIKQLKQKYKIGLLTNFTSDLERFLKDMFGIYDLFDKVVNSYTIKIKKPAPEAFMYILKEMDLKPDESIFVDDKEENILGAERVGIRSILYQNFDQFKAELEQII